MLTLWERCQVYFWSHEVLFCSVFEIRSFRILLIFYQTRHHYLFIFDFLGLHLQHMEVPTTGVKSELQLPACTTATATPDSSHVCDLRRNSWQYWILNPLSEVRDRTHIFMDTGWICYCWAMMGTPSSSFLTSTHLSEHSSPIALWGYYLTPIKLPPLAPNNTRTSFFFFFAILGLYPWHMEVPRLGVESELQLPAYTTATATWDLSHVWDLHHSSWQHWILNPLHEARDWTCILMDPSGVC